MNTTAPKKRMHRILRIRASDELHARLARVAEAKEQTASVVAREGIMKHLDAEEAKGGQA